MRILGRVEGSVLWLLEENPWAVENLRAEAARRGIAPQRLVFASSLTVDEHLARHRLADLFLDTLPYNAHTTASDALWAGLPVLTRTGETFASRVAASLLRAIGLPELITSTESEFEELAVELAHNPPNASRRSAFTCNKTTPPLRSSIARPSPAIWSPPTPPSSTATTPASPRTTSKSPALADSCMADSLQLRNHAFRLCLAGCPIHRSTVSVTSLVRE